MAAAAREAAAAAERLAQSAEADEELVLGVEMPQRHVRYEIKDSGSEKLASELLGSGPHEDSKL